MQCATRQWTGYYSHHQWAEKADVVFKDTAFWAFATFRIPAFGTPGHSQYIYVMKLNAF